jgi:multidrug transporter EmrE-like cation transporter
MLNFFMQSEVALKLLFFGLVAVAVALEIFGDVLFKKWSLGSGNALLYTGLLTYFAGSIFWAASLRYEFLSKAISVFTLLNLVIVALVGVMYFKEDLSYINKAGIALGVLSIILVEI